MLNMRLGAVPVTEVNMPRPAPKVVWSSQTMKIVYVGMVAEGKQVFSYPPRALANSAVPLEDTVTPVNN